MQINLFIVSKACWEIIAKERMNLKNTDFPVFLEMLENIYDLHPQLDPDTDFKLYWRKTSRDLLAIEDWISYTTALKLMTNNTIYMVINDTDKVYGDTRRFIKKIDEEVIAKEKEQNKSKYDVVIKPRKAPGCKCSLTELPEESDDDEDDDDEYSDTEIVDHALRNETEEKFLTADLIQKHRIVECIKKAMKGEIINYSAHKDIYFLETNTKNESTDLANLFAPPTGGDIFKYKPRLKLKQKANPALEFFIQNKPRNPSLDQTGNKSSSSYQDDAKCPHPGSSGSLDGCRTTCRTRRSSIDLYEEAASILGLTCTQTDDCKCLECQCHYFDFEEEIDFPTGSECLVEVDHSSSCSIQ